MLQILTVLFISIIVAEARTKIGKDDNVLQRVKRWRDFDCPPYYPPPHRYPHFYPPPYWHHRPPPDFYQPYSDESQRRPIGNGEKTEAMEPVSNKGEDHNEKLVAQDNNKEIPSEDVQNIAAKEPDCDNCNKSGKVAISNAESDTGDAIAISISRKN